MTFIENKKISIRQFEAEAGLSNGTLNETKKRSADLSSKNIEKISKRYADELLKAGFYILDLAAFGRPGELAILKQEEKAGDEIAPSAEQSVPEYTPSQMLSILVRSYDKQADAFKDQAKAHADQAEGFKALAEAFRAQIDLIKNIDSRMALQASLESLSSGHQLVAIRQAVDRGILLRSLARLEGKEDDRALLSEADNKINEIEAASVRLSKLHAEDMKSTEKVE